MKKIVEGVANIKKGLAERITLGNLNTSRDLGYAKDYVEAMWLCLQQPVADEFVIGTGDTHTVKQFLEAVCEVAGVEFWNAFTQDPTFDRQSQDDCLRADIRKTQTVLKWTPKVGFEELVRIMYEAESSHTR